MGVDEVAGQGAERGPTWRQAGRPCPMNAFKLPCSTGKRFRRSRRKHMLFSSLGNCFDKEKVPAVQRACNGCIGGTRLRQKTDVLLEIAVT